MFNANDKFKAALRSAWTKFGVASEEEDEAVAFNKDLNKNAKYVVLMDPLDGSSNIDVNVSVGTIFPFIVVFLRSALHRQQKTSYNRATNKLPLVMWFTALRPCWFTPQVTVSMAFTYDPSIGSFCLSHENMRIPESGKIYSINEGNYIRFPDWREKYIKFCQENVPEDNRPYTSLSALWLQTSTAICLKGTST